MEQITALQAENELLSTKQLSNGSASAPDETELQAEATALRQEKEGWVTERESLAAEIKLLKISKEDLEDDRNFFRLQYGTASAFTGQLQQENQELQLRATVAEKQVTAGVGLIRITYEVRVQKLEDELNKAKGIVKVLTDKDRLTNDDLRRRAALEPALNATIDKLREESKSLQEGLNNVVKHRNDLLVEKAEMRFEADNLRAEYAPTRDEVRSLRVELARFAARERSIMKEIHAIPDDPDAEGELEDPGEEEVFICAWAMNDRADRCGELLSSRQVCNSSLSKENREFLNIDLPHRICKIIYFWPATYDSLALPSVLVCPVILLLARGIAFCVMMSSAGCFRPDRDAIVAKTVMSCFLPPHGFVVHIGDFAFGESL